MTVLQFYTRHGEVVRSSARSVSVRFIFLRLHLALLSCEHKQWHLVCKCLDNIIQYRLR